MAEPGGGGSAAAAGTAAGAAAGAAEEAPQQGFLARMASMVLKIMLLQTLINMASSFFNPAANTPQQLQQQQQQLKNVLQPGAGFDAFVHLHYMPSAAVSSLSPSLSPLSLPLSPSLSPSLSPYNINPQENNNNNNNKPPWGLGFMVPPPKPFLPYLNPNFIIPLKTLNNKQQQITYCPPPPQPAAAAAAAAAEGAEGAAGGEAAGTSDQGTSLSSAETGESGATAAATAAEATAAAATGKCDNPVYLPAAANIFNLMNQKYTYDWWSSSIEKELPIHLNNYFLIHEDIDLFLTVTVVPHAAYDKNREQMTDEEAAAAAAGLPERLLIQRTQSLVQKMKPLKGDESQHSLLFDAPDTTTTEEDSSAEPIRHLKNRLDVSLVYDTSIHNSASLHAGPLQSLKLRYTEGTYEPMIYISDFWLIEKNFIPINDTLAEEPQNVTLSFGVGSVHAWMLQSQMAGVQQQQQQLGLQNEKEGFMLKRILIETNPLMLAFSALFILAHSVFSFFAFKNDMQFWYKNESMEGLSAASLIFGFACEVIIGLYLFDSQETSWLILFEVLIGIAISGWKLTKAMKIEKKSSFPFIKFSFTRSYSESETKDYDRTAIKYASIALAPCLVGYAIYALLNNKYRSWYSYIISVLAGSVYTFGFVLMTPQLYINYKLKSVDHLPWRALIYRSLNTFVDDVASFLIDMPWMHRLSCFRDDIIFIIYLYQRWIYRVDKNRRPGAVGEEGTALQAGETAATSTSASSEGSASAAPAAAPAAAEEEADAAAKEETEKEETSSPRAASQRCTEEPEGLRRRLPTSTGTEDN